MLSPLRFTPRFGGVYAIHANTGSGMQSSMTELSMMTNQSHWSQDSRFFSLYDDCLKVLKANDIIPTEGALVNVNIALFFVTNDCNGSDFSDIFVAQEKGSKTNPPRLLSESPVDVDLKDLQVQSPDSKREWVFTSLSKTPHGTLLWHTPNALTFHPNTSP